MFVFIPEDSFFNEEHITIHFVDLFDEDRSIVKSIEIKLIERLIHLYIEGLLENLVGILSGLCSYFDEW